ncbi:16S rRNA (guanine(527)-N(7))-methyltransferase RsmG [Pleionea litopenaei]|uniref:Ribosomal RNA small subunit methyltransferase G n=1 Tax=Pleionea litopenaei TaxID=3070815 RepID=A0AA51RR13_9GAMM|nr:16S rRNA (guanine(527)-N(7))-methyltransferase RsmG [Pleionea sp. HL-JVS1]WMS86026.1 16S rRNA (guanine(527)-N(7))-methyltransferase RsmG [Pleionea sp. HL-JVS1]
MTINNQIARGLEQLEMSVTAEQMQQLVTVIEQLSKWNQAYNLTAIREPEQMVTLHLMDSLAILPWLKPGRLLDIGTGPGFPGVPLAILDNSRSFFLLDSNGKKTRFIRQLAHQLGLDHISVVDTRVEQWQPDQPFDVITSRAFASLKKMVDFSYHLLANGGVWQAMKGELPEHEIEQLPDTVVVDDIQSLVVPELSADRHLITIRKK